MRAAFLNISSACLISVTAAFSEGGEFIRLMNLGKAQLENRDSAKAIETLAAAIRLEPRSAPGLRNLARAHLMARNSEAALQPLTRAKEVEPESPATHYLIGLANARSSRFEEAIGPWETAARLDPKTAAIRFQLAGAYSATGRPAKAQEQLKETVRLDPLHASAHYKLAGHAREAGDQAEFQARMREFTRLRKLFGEETRSADALETCVHTWPEGLSTESRKAEPMIDVRFRDATEEMFIEPSEAAATTATVLDADEDGRYTLLIVTEDGKLHLLAPGPAGRLARKTADTVLPAKALISSCIAGDFHNDVPPETRYDAKVHALNDVFLLGPDGAWLLKRMSVDRFEDVTQKAGLAGVKGRRACWVDYEHDGDVDLFVAGEAGADLWQNKGDGSFARVTAEAGLAEEGSAWDVAAVDLDGNVAVDLAVGRGELPSLVFDNKRTGQFGKRPEPPGPWPAARRVLLNDVDNDGEVDGVLVGTDRAEVIYGRGGARAHIDLGGLTFASAGLLDFDNDGRLDLWVVGQKKNTDGVGAVRLWRNDGTLVWPDVSERMGLAAMPFRSVRDLIAADLDGDADSDLLLVTPEGRLRFLRNEGGHINGQLKVRLAGLKTNSLGIGTHVELRSGEFWLTRSVAALPIELGLAGRRRVDSLQTLWTNGVVDNQVDFAPTGRPITVEEKNVATGSCPFLYAWDGVSFRFVTDLLGNSPVGLPLRRDLHLPADPDEIVSIGPAERFVPLEGRYLLQVTSEFREVLYLDSVRLLAVDHPPDVEVHPTDKLAPPPFPPSEVWGLCSLSKLIAAAGSDGIDRTEAIGRLDDVFAPPGSPLPPPYRGMCRPLSLTLDFGAPDAKRPLVLALTGWLQYGDGSTNIAMSQNPALTVIPPTLEVEASPEHWTPVDVVVGVPAGKTKTILCDLTGKLPGEARRLRLTTTFEIRWDRIALLQRCPATSGARHELAPVAAELRRRGFSEIRSRAEGHPTTPDHEKVFDRPPWRTALQGWCTRYGDVLELVAERDEKLALINAGDAVTIEFAASDLPSVPKGLVRSFFLYSVGWDKDGDHNVVEGDTVEPLPVPTIDDHSGSESDESDWRLRYNTRWVGWNAFAPRR